ncbi:MAG: adenylate/guanylate cyclase domain-containing protein, partial [Cellvibrionaceae bacterium]|nr:adenylate/guanylate cyclase domain-containing protein [Cellvibrionaceae bacterium]
MTTHQEMHQSPVDRPEELPQYPLYFRILLCFSMVATLATGLDWPNPDFVRVSFIAGLLIYLFVTFNLQQKLKTKTTPPLAVIVGTIDAFIMGLCIGLLELSLLPAALFWILLQFNAISSGGQEKWLRDNIAYFVGIATMLSIMQPNWSVNGQLEMGIAGLIGIAAYFCAYAVYTKKRLDTISADYERLNKEQVTQKLRSYQLSRYLPPPVWKAINAEDSTPPPTQRKKLTAFFSDIKDFSVLAEELEAETLTDLLNTYLTEMSKIVEEYGGTIDKFMGDAIMVLFGDNDSKGAKDDCRRCLCMAIAMRKRMKVLQQQWRNQGITRPLSIRMGINTGYCTVGTFGTRHHLDYTALGAHVNL